jgi:hypothetical protein
MRNSIIIEKKKAGKLKKSFSLKNLERLLMAGIPIKIIFAIIRPGEKTGELTERLDGARGLI